MRKATIKVRAMFGNDVDNDRNQFKGPVKVVNKACEADPTGKLRAKKHRVYAAAEYDRDSFKNQTIYAKFNKKRTFLSMKCNRKGSKHDQYALNCASVRQILDTYRNDNNLKCFHFIYVLKDTGETFTDQNKFAAAAERFYYKGV